MEYTFDSIRKNKLLLYEYIRGSQSYGLALPTSDEDRGAVFCMTNNDALGLSDFMVDQVNDERNDTVWYEVGKYLKLLTKANPTMLESLFVPERCIVYMHPAFKVVYDNRDMFVTKETFNSFCSYAKSQIEKARGLNKKIVNPIFEKKDVLDFCYTFKGEGTTPIKKFLKEHNYDQKNCGLVHLPNMDNMYAVYYDPTGTFGYRGIIDTENSTTQVRLSSIPKGETPICYISFNENGFVVHCKKYKEYQDWVKHRNPQRFLENQGKEFDRKNMMHCIRLLTMGIEIAKTGKVNVDRTNIDKDFLLNIRLGNTTYDEIIAYAEQKQAELIEAIKYCTLPEKVDIQKVNNILIEIRKLFN